MKNGFAHKSLCLWNTAISSSLSRLKMVIQGSVSYFSMLAEKIQYGNSALVITNTPHRQLHAVYCIKESLVVCLHYKEQ